MSLDRSRLAPRVRRAAVAGSFYPAVPDTLRSIVDDLLARARATDARVPKALIVPHAGYVYSGAVAALAYALLSSARDRIRRVVLLGPSHRVAVDGCALAEVDAFETPLGAIPIDAPSVDAVQSLRGVVRDDRPHAAEHSLEVQLPFLQCAIGNFSLVPFSVGRASPDVIAAILEHLWGDDSTLVVISSDLSHYEPYDVARALDRATVDRMLALDTRIAPAMACGATPVNGFLEAARRRALHPELIDLRNSGDTAGPRDRVVGYAALAFYE